jgi:rare lipoprotein A
MGFLPALLTVKANAEIGFASHYGNGDGFHGRRTASGERFNRMAMTAAHRTRRMGTHVTVTNLANGRSVVVRISDRGPARRTGKIIDLSYGASRAIGMGRDRKGISPIRSIGKNGGSERVQEGSRM